MTVGKNGCTGVPQKEENSVGEWGGPASMMIRFALNSKQDSPLSLSLSPSPTSPTQKWHSQAEDAVGSNFLDKSWETPKTGVRQEKDV